MHLKFWRQQGMTSLIDKSCESEYRMQNLCGKIFDITF